MCHGVHKIESKGRGPRMDLWKFLHDHTRERERERLTTKNTNYINKMTTIM